MPTQAGKLVLVVDDDEVIRDLLRHLLKKEGYRVETAVDGEEGLLKAENLKPDLLILDLMLPRHGGFEVLRHLQGGDMDRTPIIVITGRCADRALSDLIRRESNVVEVMLKPIKTQALLLALERNLSPRAAFCGVGSGIGGYQAGGF